MSKSAAAFTDLADDRAPLKRAGIGHGTMVYMSVGYAREVAAAVKANTEPFGKKMTVEDLVARQTVVECQETAHCTGASFDRNAANAFQLYIAHTLNFAVGRCGFLFGTCDEETGKVDVQLIYEPEQDSSPQGFTPQWDESEELRTAEFVAEHLGYKRVGFVFAVNAKERGEEYTISADELRLMAKLQSEGGKHFVFALVAEMETEDGQAAVNFEAFQLSDQCVKMYNDGFFVDGENPAAVKLKPNAEVVVLRKEVEEVDCQLFLVPVPILDHEGPLKASFPVENRLIGQTNSDLKAALQKNQNKPFVERLADFHLLLYLARSSSLDVSDVMLLADAVRSGQNVQDGYRLIIESLAGL